MRNRVSEQGRVGKGSGASRIILALLIVFIINLGMPALSGAAIWLFGSSGSGQNPFTPRGYMISIEGQNYWLSSGYDNSGANVVYTGARNGIDYLEATPPGGGTYNIYAQTDRNPLVSRDYLAVYKNGSRMSLAPYAGAPSRGDIINPNGLSSAWVIPIRGFVFDPGSVYEFIFLRGMQANNGITLALAPGTLPGRYLGYYQNPSGAELNDYYAQSGLEYRFVESYSQETTTNEFNVNFIPMRFSVQTYASLQKWQQGRQPAVNFAASVKQADYDSGTYRPENIESLRNLIAQLDARATDEVRYYLQPTADPIQDEMITQLNIMLEKARSERRPESDLAEFKKKLSEAQGLHEEVKNNTGLEVGQYGVVEVQNLATVIAQSLKIDRFTPQDQVDARTQELNNAILAVKASRVMKTQRIFFDRATGIYVIVPIDALPEEAALNVMRLGQDEPDYLNAMADFDQADQRGELYRLQFYVDEKPISPTAPATVQMPLSKDISPSQSVIYLYDAQTGLSPLSSVQANGFRIFKVDDLGMFLLAGPGASKEEVDTLREQHKDQETAGIIKQSSIPQNDPDIKTNSLEQMLQDKEIHANPIEMLLDSSESLPPTILDTQRPSNPSNLIFVALGLIVIVLMMSGRIVWNRRSLSGSEILA
jgi:hypothetical protein